MNGEATAGTAGGMPAVIRSGAAGRERPMREQVEPITAIER